MGWRNTLSPLQLASSSALDWESENIPYLSERMLIDLVGGVEVIGEQLRYREANTLFSRLLGSFDGTNQLRQQLIDEHFRNSVAALTSLAERLCEHGRFTAQALGLVADKLRGTRKHLEELTDFSVETRERVYALETKLDRMSREVDERIKRLELLVRVNNRIEEVFAAWHAGRHYAKYPPLIQAALALEDLSRGEEGNHIFTEENYRSRVADRATTILREFTGLNSLDFYPLEDWLKTFASFPPAAEPFRRLTAAYLISKNNRPTLHSLLAEYAETDAIPQWVGEKQESGELSVILRTTLLLNQYSGELNPVEDLSPDVR